MIEVIPDTICQHTGLTDKNGNKIWENDVVKHVENGLGFAWMIVNRVRRNDMEYQEAYEILHPETTRKKLAEIEYYGGFAGQEKTIKAVEEACLIACEAILELQTLKSQIDDDLESHISELKQAKFDIETFWEEPAALSKALQNAIRALMEIQQYRQIGNLEEIRLKLGAFDQIKWERDIAIAQLTDIGCSLGEKMDDVVAAVERQKPMLLQAKKAYNKGYMINAYHCPTCNEQICFEGERRSTTISNTYKYCKKCGQAIDWREE